MKAEKMMKVLVACEESQAVAKELRKLGHEAYSCDTEPCSGGRPEWHIQSDVLPLLDGNCNFQTMDDMNHEIIGKWDMIIAFPPCTYLTTAGNRWFNVERYGDKAIQRQEDRKQAFKFFMQFANADCERIAIENPQGYMNTHFRKPDQIIHPYYFAYGVDDDRNYHQKKTCLWLKGLKPLEVINNLPKPHPRYICQGEKSKGKAIGWCEGLSGVSGQMERAKARSKTFPGVAKAMAEQWGGEFTQGKEAAGHEKDNADCTV